MTYPTQTSATITTSAPEAAPAPDETSTALRRLRKRTDLGNAERLADNANGKLLWVHGQGWLCWDRKRWQRDESNRVMQTAADTARKIYAEASAVNKAASEADEDGDGDLGKLAKEISSWALKSESHRALTAMVKLGASQKRLILEGGATKLDSDPNLLNVQNGVLDLGSMELRGHDPRLHMTKLANAGFDPKAEAPFFRECVEKALPDEEVRHWVQMAAGYSMLGSYSEYLFVPFGKGANLKSTVLYGLRHALGDYAAEAASDLLVARREWGAAAESALAGLRGSRFITTIETEQGKRLAEVLVKQLTGEAEITAKFMRQDYFTFQNQAAVWLATNHKPIVQGMDLAIWRRIRLIPFTETVPPHERIEASVVQQKLREEADGILLWLVEGLVNWRTDSHGGLTVIPRAIREATDEYQKQMDPLGEWIEDCCELDAHAFAASGALRKSYDAHCKQNGRAALGAVRFNEALTEMGVVAMKQKQMIGNKQQRARQGIRLVAAGDDPDVPAHLVPQAVVSGSPHGG
jgi:putative DNA primase/helicase